MTFTHRYIKVKSLMCRAKIKTSHYLLFIKIKLLLFIIIYNPKHFITWYKNIVVFHFNRQHNDIILLWSLIRALRTYYYISKMYNSHVHKMFCKYSFRRHTHNNDVPPRWHTPFKYQRPVPRETVYTHRTQSRYLLILPSVVTCR